MEDIEKLVNELEIKNGDNKEYPQDDMRLLGDKLKENQSVKVNALLFKTLADLTREEGNRNLMLISIPFLLEVISEIFGKLLNRLKINGIDSLDKDEIYELEMICRLLGNLTFNQEDNRNRIYNYPIIYESVTEFIRQSTYSTLRKNACATLSNIASDHEQSQNRFFDLGAVLILLHVILDDTTTSEDIKIWALKALSNLTEEESHQINITNQHIKQLHKELTKSLNQDGWVNNTLATDLVQLLSEFATNERLQEELLKDGFLNDLISLVENVESQRNMVDDMDDEDIDEHDFKEKHLSVAPLVSDLVQKLAENDKIRKYFNDSVLIKKMISIITIKPPVFETITKQNTLKVIDQAKVTRIITRALAYASLDDDISEKLIEHYKLFIRLLEDQECEQIVSAAMIIGNLAINEKNNKILLSTDVIDIMAMVMDKFPNHQPIQHLVLNACRNVTIPTVNKDYIAKESLMQPIIANMMVPNQVIQFASVGVLKHLVVSSDENYRNFINFGGLKALCDLSNGRVKASLEDDDEEESNEKITEIKEDGEDTKEEENDPKKEKKPKDMRVQYEASRLLLKFFEKGNSIVKDTIVLETIRSELVKPMFNLLTSPFPILQHEGSQGFKLIINFSSTTDNNNNNNNNLINIISDKIGDQWLETLFNLIKASFIPSKQLREYNTTENMNNPTQKQLIQQLQFNQSKMNEVQMNLLTVLYQLALPESNHKYLKDHNIIQNLKEIKNNEDSNNEIKSQVQKILVLLTV